MKCYCIYYHNSFASSIYSKQYTYLKKKTVITFGNDVNGITELGIFRFTKQKQKGIELPKRRKKSESNYYTNDVITTFQLESFICTVQVIMDLSVGI